MTAIDDIAAERKRHVEVEGWTLGHDDAYRNGELAQAAAAYARAASYSDFFRTGRKTNDKILQAYDGSRFSLLRELWPWDWSWWKPTNRRRDLVKAGALIVAEIERLDRASSTAPKP